MTTNRQSHANKSQGSDGWKSTAVRKISMWSERRIGKILMDAARFISQLEARSEDQHFVVRFASTAMKDLAPIPVGTLQSPLRVITEVMKGVSHEAPERFHRAVVWLMKQPTQEFDTEDLLSTLQLLVKIEVSNSEFVANLALQRLIGVRSARDQEESISEALVYLCGTDGGAHACLMMVEALRERGFSTVFAAEAALRVVAASEPSQLSFAFRSLRADFEDKCAGGGLHQVLEDVLARASALSVLIALTSLHPKQHPALCRASFGRSKEDNAVFVLRRESVGGGRPHSLLALRSEHRYRLADYCLPGIGRLSAEQWNLHLLQTLNFVPPHDNNIEAQWQVDRAALSQTEDVQTVGPLEKAVNERLGLPHAKI